MDPHLTTKESIAADIPSYKLFDSKAVLTAEKSNYDETSIHPWLGKE